MILARLKQGTFHLFIGILTAITLVSPVRSAVEEVLVIGNYLGGSDYSYAGTDTYSHIVDLSYNLDSILLNLDSI